MLPTAATPSSSWLLLSVILVQALHTLIISYAWTVSKFHVRSLHPLGELLACLLSLCWIACSQSSSSRGRRRDDARRRLLSLRRWRQSIPWVVPALLDVLGLYSANAVAMYVPPIIMAMSLSCMPALVALLSCSAAALRLSTIKKPSIVRWLGVFAISLGSILLLRYSDVTQVSTYVLVSSSAYALLQLALKSVRLAYIEMLFRRRHCRHSSSSSGDSTTEMQYQTFYLFFYNTAVKLFLRSSAMYDEPLAYGNDYRFHWVWVLVVVTYVGSAWIFAMGIATAGSTTCAVAACIARVGVTLTGMGGSSAMGLPDIRVQNQAGRFITGALCLVVGAGTTAATSGESGVENVDKTEGPTQTNNTSWWPSARSAVGALASLAVMSFLCFLGESSTRRRRIRGPSSPHKTTASCTSAASSSFSPSLKISNAADISVRLDQWHLFVPNSLIVLQHSVGTVLESHAPVLAANDPPVLLGVPFLGDTHKTSPMWEGNLSGYFSIVQTPFKGKGGDPTTSLLLFRAVPDVQINFELTSLMTTQDGIHFTRPKIGNVAYEILSTNILFFRQLPGNAKHNLAFFRDENPKSLFPLRAVGGTDSILKKGVHGGLQSFTVRNGRCLHDRSLCHGLPFYFHWDVHHGTMTTAEDHPENTVPESFFDGVSTVIWDPYRKRYTVFVRNNRAAGERKTSMAWSEDFMHWSPLVSVTYPSDNLNCYALSPRFLKGTDLLVVFPQCYVYDKQTGHQNIMNMFVSFLVSQDGGKVWQYGHEGQKMDYLSTLPDDAGHRVPNYHRYGKGDIIAGSFDTRNKHFFYYHTETMLRRLELRRNGFWSLTKRQTTHRHLIQGGSRDAILGPFSSENEDIGGMVVNFKGTATFEMWVSAKEAKGPSYTRRIATSRIMMNSDIEKGNADVRVDWECFERVRAGTHFVLTVEMETGTELYGVQFVAH